MDDQLLEIELVADWLHDGVCVPNRLIELDFEFDNVTLLESLSVCENDGDIEIEKLSLTLCERDVLGVIVTDGELDRDAEPLDEMVDDTDGVHEALALCDADVLGDREKLKLHDMLVVRLPLNENDEEIVGENVIVCVIVAICVAVFVIVGVIDGLMLRDIDSEYV